MTSSPAATTIHRMQLSSHSSTTAADVARALEHSECSARCDCHRTARNGYGYTHCPHHADATPSAHVKPGDRGAAFVITCFTCGKNEQRQVFEAARALLGDDPPPLRPLPARTPKRRPSAPSATAGHKGRRLVATYEIRDGDGVLVARRHRYEGPQHGQRDADGAKTNDKAITWEWVGEPRPTDDLLYGEERLAALPDGETVLWNEGEKATDAAPTAIMGVGSVGGAGVPLSDRVLALFDRLDLVLVADADPSGAAAAEDLAARRHARGLRTRWLTLPDAQPKDDLADYGGTADELATLVAAAPYWEPPAIDDPRDAEIARLRRQLTFERTRAERAEATYSALLKALQNARTRPKVSTIVALTKEYESALHRGALDAHGMLTTYIGTGHDEGLAHAAGMAPRTLHTQMKELTKYQIDGQPLVVVDRREVHGSDGQVRTRTAYAIPFIANGGTAPELYREVAAYTPTDEQGEPTRRPGGSAGRCPTCDGGLERESQVVRRTQRIERWEIRCTRCGQVHDRGTTLLGTEEHPERAPRTIRLDLPDLPTGGQNGRLRNVVDGNVIPVVPADVPAGAVAAGPRPPAAIMADGPPLPPGHDHWCPGPHQFPVPLRPQASHCSGCTRAEPPRGGGVPDGSGSPSTAPAARPDPDWCPIHQRRLLMYGEQRHYQATGEWRCETCAVEDGGLPLGEGAP
jgi:hypothetical protein